MQTAQKKEAHEGSREPVEESLPKIELGILINTNWAVNHRRLQISKYLASVAPKPQTAKPSAVRSQRLCLRPPTPPLPPIRSSGIRQGYRTGSGVGVHLCPRLPFRDCGDAQSDWRSIARSGCRAVLSKQRYCEKKRSARNQLPWSDLCEHLGMGDVSRRSHSLSAVRSLLRRDRSRACGPWAQGCAA